MLGLKFWWLFSTMPTHSWQITPHPGCSSFWSKEKSYCLRSSWPRFEMSRVVDFVLQPQNSFHISSLEPISAYSLSWYLTFLMLSLNTFIAWSSLRCQSPSSYHMSCPLIHVGKVVSDIVKEASLGKIYN